MKICIYEKLTHISLLNLADTTQLVGRYRKVTDTDVIFNCSTSVQLSTYLSYDTIHLSNIEYINALLTGILLLWHQMQALNIPEQTTLVTWEF